MMKSILLRSCPSPALFESKDVRRSGLSPSSASSRAYTIRCSSISDENPKFKPFNGSGLHRTKEELPLIDKAKQELADYCKTLRGGDAYDCWRACLDLNDLEKLVPMQDLERMIRAEGSAKSLMEWVPRTAAIYREAKEKAFGKAKLERTETKERVLSHIPEWLPKTEEELEKEEKLRMEEPSFIKLLRFMGRKDTDINYDRGFIWD